MKKLLPLVCALLASGCEVLEEDISHKSVSIIAPADRVAVPAGTVDFRWSETEYAAGYELTVIAPSFAAAGRVAADTVIWADTLARRFGCRVTLAEGAYEWCVRAFNDGYKTRPEIRSLTVLPAENPGSSETPEPPGS